MGLEWRPVHHYNSDRRCARFYSFHGLIVIYFFREEWMLPARMKESDFKLSSVIRFFDVEKKQTTKNKK